MVLEGNVQGCVAISAEEVRVGPLSQEELDELNAGFLDREVERGVALVVLHSEISFLKLEI